MLFLDVGVVFDHVDYLVLETISFDLGASSHIWNIILLKEELYDFPVVRHYNLIYRIHGGVLDVSG